MNDRDLLKKTNHLYSSSSDLPVHVLVLTLLLFSCVSFINCGCREQSRQSRECESICRRNPNGTWFCELRAVVLLPNMSEFDASLPKVMTVFELAEKAIRSQQILPPKIAIKWIPYDDACQPSIALISAMDGHSNDCAHVLFGPTCDYALAPIARIVKYFNLDGTPLITGSGFAGDFLANKTNCSDEYYMLIRTGLLNYKTIAYAMVEIMKNYDWKKVVFIYDRNGHHNLGFQSCYICMNTLAGLYRESNITYVPFTTDGIKNMTETLMSEVGLTRSSFGAFGSTITDAVRIELTENDILQLRFLADVCQISK